MEVKIILDYFLSWLEGDTSENTHALWGMSRDWYAQYLLDNGRYQEAFSQFQEAFLTSCELFGDTHPQTLVVLNSLGKLFISHAETHCRTSFTSKASLTGLIIPLSHSMWYNNIIFKSKKN